MTTEDLRVAVYRLRTTFGRRRGSYLAIVLLVGLVGGTAMGALVAARRTQSAFSTYLASTNPSDLSVSIYAVSGGASLPYSRSMESEALGLPGVKHVEALIDVSAFPLQPDGVPVLTTATTSSTLMLASIDGLFFNQDRLVATQGRMAVANRPDEMVMSPTAAHVLGFHVGEVIPYGIFTAHQVNLPAFGTPRVRPSLRVQARLVGLVQFNNAVVEDDIDRLPTFVVFTPALAHDIITGPAKGAQEAVSLAFQLKKGNAGVPAVESTLPRVLPADAVYQFHATAPVEQKVDASVKPLTIALAVFGLVAALAALVIGAQVISRQHRFLQEELETLRALGAPPGTLLADGLLGTMGAVLVGSLLAVGVSTALSPLSPLGPVRSVFPGPWVAVDWTVEGLGFVALAVVLGAVAVFVGYRGAPHRVARRSRLASPRTSIAAGVAASSGLPVAATVGLRFALEPGKGRTSVPVRSALVGGSLAVALVVATLTFGSGLRNLVSHPALYGWNWSYILNPTNTVPPKALSLLDKDTDVANWTGYDYNDADIDGQGVPFLFEGTGRPGQSPLSPPILSGHGLEGKDEIVLGAATLALLDKRVGDTVTVSYGQPADAPLYISP
ncbi:MAG TPA: hypothetical protein VK425_07085, partial [Acidimicrobiales bacterium]|nr:hypothetical protein [Acidimicrobiales bacterium]